MKGFKKCNNGHYYKDELSACPYCPSGSATENRPTQTVGGGQSFDDKTQVYGGNATTHDDGRTKVVGGNERPTTPPKGAPTNSNHTVFITEIEEETEGGGVKVVQTTRASRRLVGWLVSYTIDSMGVDFKLYEGRNSIGRDADCQITVPDNTASGKHAILLFRADKYSITDQQSTHGTFVNDEDTGLEPHYIKDGDIIRVGQTVFKFRTSL